jgi:hypothetical protein
MPLHFLFEGIDGVGKDTIINELIKILGYRSVIHMSKPKSCAIYDFDLKQYQDVSFTHLMNLLNQNIPLIFNRSHIGEKKTEKYYHTYIEKWNEIGDVYSNNFIQKISILLENDIEDNLKLNLRLIFLDIRNYNNDLLKNINEIL